MWTLRLLDPEEEDQLGGEEGEAEVHVDHVPLRPLAAS